MSIGKLWQCEATFRTQTAFFQHRCLEHKPLALAGGQGVRSLKGPTGRSYRNAEKNICEICGASVAVSICMLLVQILLTFTCFKKGTIHFALVRH